MMLSRRLRSCTIFTPSHNHPSLENDALYYAVASRFHSDLRWINEDLDLESTNTRSARTGSDLTRW